MSEITQKPESSTEGSTTGDSDSPELVPKAFDQEKRESMEENLERLAALNLSNDPSLQPRLSTAMIRLVSALAGAGLLVLIYFIFKLFV